MTKKRKIINLEERCRLCLTDEGSMSALFVKSLENEIQDLSCSTSVDIKKQSHLPKNVCHVCLYKLNMWAEFKERFLRTNKLLMSNFESSEDAENQVKMDDESSMVGESWQMDLDEDEGEEEEGDESMPVSQENGRDTSPMRKGSIKTSMEKRRKMMTKRWGERKRALVAATGELVSESDSVASDNVELSPVRKARAKTNAEKELEQRKKRVDRALKQLEIDANFPVDMKSIRSVADTSRKSLLHSNSPSQNHSKEPKENYVPRSVKSEFEIGDATYIVTSTLFFAESQAAGSEATSGENTKSKEALKKEPQDDSKGMDEKNSSDIFAAVQLRRVNPKSPPTRGKNSLERCLNIEVEGRELEALENLQHELAAFVEKDMKDKLSDSSSIANSKDLNSQQLSLEERLKSIVEKAIRSNYETSQTGKDSLSQAFVEAAERSAVFQPKVLVDRLSPEVIGKVDNPRGKRRAAQQPARYRDYDVSGMGSDDEEKTKPELTAGWPRLAAASAYKVVYDSFNQSATNQQYSPIISKQHLTTPKQQLPKPEMKMCSFCSKAFSSLQEITEHVKTHHQKPEKPKLMRCKRCHEIVEARFVKMHVCNNRQPFKCNVCNMPFKSDKQLIAHLQTAHIQPKKTVPNARDSQQGATNSSAAIVLSNLNQTKSEQKQTLACCFCDKTFMDKNVLHDHVQQHCDQASVKTVTKENFCCGICGNSMESEEALEKHVRWHLYDDADDNPNLINIQSQDKEEEMEFKEEIIQEKKPTMLQCPECPQEFASEALLVMHQPLHAEEAKIANWMKQDDGPVTYGCSLCESVFQKESLLNLHMLEHSKTSTVCVLCERLFETLEQLQEHVKTH